MACGHIVCVHFVGSPVHFVCRGSARALSVLGSATCGPGQVPSLLLAAPAAAGASLLSAS